MHIEDLNKVSIKSPVFSVYWINLLVENIFLAYYFLEYFLEWLFLGNFKDIDDGFSDFNTGKTAHYALLQEDEPKNFPEVFAGFLSLVCSFGLQILDLGWLRCGDGLAGWSAGLQEEEEQEEQEEEEEEQEEERLCPRLWPANT